MILRLLLFVAFFGTASLPATAAEPFARAAIATGGKIIAGERIEVTVDVLVPNFFKSAPDFPLFDIEKAIVILPEARAVNLAETVDGIQYSGIRRSYAIIPQVAGGYRLPEIGIAVTFAGDDGEPLERTVTVPPVDFTAAPVPGDWQGQRPFVATDVTITETLDRDPAKLKAGDSIVRQITVTAAGTRAMMIPALDPGVAAGVRLYRQDPMLADDVTAGTRTDASRRVETLTYLVEKPGKFTLPAIGLEWLDAAGGAIRTASRPAVGLIVSAAPARQAIVPPSAEDAAAKTARRRAFERHLARIALLAVGMTLVFALLYWIGAWAERTWRRRTEAYRQSEPFFFRTARKALSGDDARTAFDALEQWTRRLGLRSVEAWAQSTGDVDIQRRVGALQRALFGRPDADAPEPPFQEIARLMVDARRRALASFRRSSAAPSVLPPLNP